MSETKTISIGFEKLSSNSNKIMKFIRKRFKNPVDAYMALKLVILFLEETGISLDKESEALLVQIIKDSRPE